MSDHITAGPTLEQGEGRPLGYTLEISGVRWEWLGDGVGWARQTIAPRDPSQPEAPPRDPPREPSTNGPRWVPPWAGLIVTRLRRIGR